MVSQNVLNLVDTYMVGSLGDAALAAVGMGGFANWLAMAFITGLATGVQAMSARRLGEGKTEEMAVPLNGGLLQAIVLGVPMSLLAVHFASDLFPLLVNDPEVLILDEPLTGLDPVQRRHVIALFHRLGDEGRCVLVSSHVLDEVAKIGSRVLVIAQGRLVARGDYRDLRELMDDRAHRIRLAASDPRKLATALVERGLVSGLSIDERNVMVDTLDVDAFGRQVAAVSVELGVRLTEVAPLDDDLESVFRYLVEGR